MPITSWIAPVPQDVHPLPQQLPLQILTVGTVDNRTVQEMLDKINELTYTVQSLTATIVEIRTVIDDLP